MSEREGRRHKWKADGHDLCVEREGFDISISAAPPFKEYGDRVAAPLFEIIRLVSELDRLREVAKNIRDRLKDRAENERENDQMNGLEVGPVGDYLNDLWRGLASALATDGAEGKICTWSEDDDGVWSTGCDNAFILTEGGTPKEHEMNFCCYCGKIIAFERYTAPSESEGEPNE